MKKTSAETPVFNEADIQKITTLGALKAAGYHAKTVKEELRDNLIRSIQNNTPRFEGILGYEDTVIPQIENAILAGHNINLLGLRGQAKTRIARALVQLLDPYVPVIKGSFINEDPMKPLTTKSKQRVREEGDALEITWMARAERYVEKLATPDVTVADLIGDIDPIKAANLKLSFADEEVIHFGLVPRANRGLFVINELPDLQARIQVALFNVLQENDIQIRGFKLRLPLDTYFIFTANPEDYTNRGSIITPLKDRIQAQIVTHYPNNLEIGKAITRQEAKLTDAMRDSITVPEVIAELIEQIAVEARNSEYVDANSGVSARLTISAYENAVGQAYRRMLANGDQQEVVRISDLYMVVPAINGKIELVYEGEQEGSVNVARQLIGSAIRSLSARYFKGLEKQKREESPNPYETIIEWFGGQTEGFELLLHDDVKNYIQKLKTVQDLEKRVVEQLPEMKDATLKAVYMEFLLHALAQYSRLDAKLLVGSGFKFSDLISGYFNFEGGAPNFN